MALRFDPEASLRIWAVEAVVQGRVLRVPPLSAADWLPVIMSGNPLAVLDLAEDFDVAGSLMDDGVTSEELIKVLGELIEAASGRTLWATFGIAMAARERWEVIGADLARVGVRFEEISLGAGLDAIYGSIVRHMPDEKALAAFNRALEAEQVESSVRSRIPRDAPQLPAIAEQYARVRPKTVPRRPQDPQGVSSAQPTPLPSPRADSAVPIVDAQPL